MWKVLFDNIKKMLETLEENKQLIKKRIEYLLTINRGILKMVSEYELFKNLKHLQQRMTEKQKLIDQINTMSYNISLMYSNKKILHKDYKNYSILYQFNKEIINFKTMRGILVMSISTYY